MEVKCADKSNSKNASDQEEKYLKFPMRLEPMTLANQLSRRVKQEQAVRIDG